MPSNWSPTRRASVTSMPWRWSRVGRGPEALRVLDAVLEQHPYDVDALEAAAAVGAAPRRAATALGYLMTLRALRPGDQAIEQQIDRLGR